MGFWSSDPKPPKGLTPEQIKKKMREDEKKLAKQEKKARDTRRKKVAKWAGGKSLDKISDVKSRLATGTCLGCNRAMTGGSKDFYHGNCARKAQANVEKWTSIHDINNTPYYPCGVHNKNGYADFQHDQICNNKPKKGW